MAIFIPSYTYIYERHLRVFDYFTNKEDLVFILPKIWKAKGGKLIVKPPQSSDFSIIPAWAPFYHSRYPIIGGLLKAWMPNLGTILRKLSKPGDVLLSSAEPYLLTTYLYSRLCKKLGLKHVFLTWQNLPYPEIASGPKLKIKECLIRQNINLSAGALCGSKQAYDVLKPYLNSIIRTEVIPQSGVDSDLFKPDIPNDFRKKYNLENKVVFLFGAVFDERKGVFTTIKAFSKVVKQVPSSHLVMIGMGPLWQEARELARKLSLGDKILFIEWLPNDQLPPILASSDIFVHPSEPRQGWEEQYGWSILQASASGLPVISTKIGAISEAVLDGKTGVLIEPKNPQALAQAMIRLASNSEVRKKMGEEGREYMLVKYSHRVVARKLEKFLRSL